MSSYLPPLISFTIGTLMTLGELLTSKYPRTSFLLLRRSWALYLYAVIYGVISLGVMLVFKPLSEAGYVKLAGLGLSNIWVRAIVVGVATKAFLHISLFSVGGSSIGSKPIPLGTETIVHLFEPWLLETIILDDFNAVKEFIGKAVAHYPDLAAVKQTMIEELPQNLPKENIVALKEDLNTKTSVGGAMELYLRSLGSGTFKRVFPF